MGLTIFAIISIAVFITFYRLFGLPTRSARELGKRRSPLFAWADKSGSKQRLDLHPIVRQKLAPIDSPVTDRLPLISFRRNAPLVEMSPTFPLPTPFPPEEYRSHYESIFDPEI